MARHSARSGSGQGRFKHWQATSCLLYTSYLQQDMREFELYGTVRAIVSICDSMNYLEDYEDLVQVLKLANNYLDPKGVFVFDMNTVYKYREQLGEQTIAENREESSFIWENYFEDVYKRQHPWGLLHFLNVII